MKRIYRWNYTGVILNAALLLWNILFQTGWTAALLITLNIICGTVSWYCLQSGKRTYKRRLEHELERELKHLHDFWRHGLDEETPITWFLTDNQTGDTIIGT